MEENGNRKKIALIVTMMLIILTVIGVTTYALWQLTRKQTNRNVVKTTCLNITFGNESGDIDLQNAWPTSDADGAELAPYTFTITNTCSDPINYSVALESITDTENYITDYLNYNYIKVKLDNGNPAIYNNLTSLTNDTPDDYEVRTTKEIAHHTLAGGTSVTHSLRIWVDENTPLENDNNTLNSGKYFFGKIKVIAGQGIEGDPKINEDLKVLTISGEPVARLNNVNVGDKLGYKGEEFYVIGIDGNNVKLLSRYLLNVGEHPNPNGTEGLQYDQLGCTRTNVLDSGSATVYGHIGGPFYGAVAFSLNNYWFDEDEGDWLGSYGQHDFIYNNQATIYNYVDAYVNTLITMGLNVTNGTLLSLEEVRTLCNTNIPNWGNYSSQCPNYLFETTYWLGNVYDDGFRVWLVYEDGNVESSYNYNSSSTIGVRPVITVSLS